MCPVCILYFLLSKCRCLTTRSDSFFFCTYRIVEMQEVVMQTETGGSARCEKSEPKQSAQDIRKRAFPENVVAFNFKLEIQVALL